MKRLALALLALAALAIAWLAWRPVEKVARAVHRASGYHRVESYAEVVREVAKESNLDPNLLAGVMFVESRGQLRARSPAGALGLLQLMPSTAVEQAFALGLDEPSDDDLLGDASLNVRLGAWYLAGLIRRNGGDVERALIAYNAGPGKLARWIREAGSYPRWRDAAEVSGRSDVLRYARDVLSARDQFASAGVIASWQGPPAPPPARRSTRTRLVGPMPPDDVAPR